ncbi:MAG: hypothetical protein FWH39_04265 [Bacteroidales bacterium]|nr:hypothetical protein [Bacteroidales bacterium]
MNINELRNGKIFKHSVEEVVKKIPKKHKWNIRKTPADNCRFGATAAVTNEEQHEILFDFGNLAFLMFSVERTECFEKRNEIQTCKS